MENTPKYQPSRGESKRQHLHTTIAINVNTTTSTTTAATLDCYDSSYYYKGHKAENFKKFLWRILTKQKHTPCIQVVKR